MSEQANRSGSKSEPTDALPRKHHIPLWFVLISFLVLGAIKTYVDPFDIDEASRGLAQDAIMRGYLSPNYGTGTGYKELTHQVSVALIRQNFLDELSEKLPAMRKEAGGSAQQGETKTATDRNLGWPLPLSMHAQILDAILLHQPKAVFIDILFVDERPGDGVNAMRSLLLRNIKAGDVKEGNLEREAAVPIFFAQAIGLEMRADLWNASCAGDRAHECESDNEILRGYISNHLVPVPKKPERGIVRFYPVEFRIADRYRPTPAFALLDRIDIASAWPPEQLRWRGRAWSNLEIIWGTTPYDTNQEWMGEEIDGTTRLCKPFKYGFFDQHLYALFRSEQKYIQTCPYIATIPVESLLNLTADHHIPPMIKDKIVFYGVDLIGATDVVYPPVHKRLPGVYMHAMALDNLITLGPDYLRRGRYSNEIEMLVLLAFGLLFTAFRYLDRHIDIHHEQKPRPLRKALLRVLIFVLFVVFGIGLLAGAGYVLTVYFRLAPLDWIGILALAAWLSLPWMDDVIVWLLRRLRQLGSGTVPHALAAQAPAAAGPESVTAPSLKTDHRDRPPGGK